MKKLKIRPDIKLTQVYFFLKSGFPSPSRLTAIKRPKQGYGEVVPNDSVKFSIRGFDGKLLFY